MPRTTAPKIKRLNLALQGGGSHGAYAWGVLDALLEDGRIDFDGICATSAGSVNAAAVAYGLTIGDRDMAREMLEKLWQKISDAAGVFAPPTVMPNGFEMPKFNMPGQEDAYFSMFEAFTNIMSPYQFNPLNINLLQRVIDDTIEVKKIRKCNKVKLFITATDVQTGHAKVFRNADMTTDVILASACLPFLFQAVKIKGRSYWDGGYVGNPALWPLFYETDTADLCVIHLNPIDRKKIPTTPYEIDNRINEISFNSSLLSELRAIAFVKKLIEKDWLRDKYKKRMRDILLHAIRADDELKKMSVGTKFQTDWPFLLDLRNRGRRAAKAWLKTNFAAIGKRETVDIHEEFLDFVT